MELSELLKKTKELELVARRHAFSLLAGEYVTKLPGRGLMFHEARKYIPGESIRLIDWNLTARLGEPYVKVLLEEREREVIIALDVSPSMHTGWMERTKLEYAVELAATLAYSCVRSRDKLGYILFNNKTVGSSRPRSGKIQLFRALRNMLEEVYKTPNENHFTDIRIVFHELQKQRNKKFIVFVISDFFDRDIPDDLRYVKEGSDISFFHIYDPLEYTSTENILIPAFSPEKETILNKGMIHLSTIQLDEVQKFLKDVSLKYRISVESFSTKEDIGKKLSFFFHKKKRRVL